MSIIRALVAANTTRNLGRTDRRVRLLLPLVVAGLWLGGLLPDPAALVLGVVAVMLFPTAITGACSIYYVLGISTCPVQPGTTPQPSVSAERPRS